MATELVYHLSAGEKARVECGRSGTFVAKQGGKVTLTQRHLDGMVERFDSSEEHLVKIGHGPIRTDSPAYGEVVALDYNRGRDRLLADIVPTPALVRRNREEGFKHCSLELTREDDGYRFEHLAFLAAHRPAIDGLAAIMLASAEDVAGVVLTSADDADADWSPEEKAMLAAADPDQADFYRRVKRVERSERISFAEAFQKILREADLDAGETSDGRPPGVEPLSFAAAEEAKKRSRSAGISFAAAIDQLYDDGNEDVRRYVDSY